MHVLDFLQSHLPRPIAFTLAGLYIIVGRFWKRPIRWTLNFIVNLSVLALALFAAIGWYLELPTRHGHLWWQLFLGWMFIVALVDYLFSDPVFDDPHTIRLPRLL